MKHLKKGQNNNMTANGLGFESESKTNNNSNNNKNHMHQTYGELYGMVRVQRIYAWVTVKKHTYPLQLNATEEEKEVTTKTARTTQILTDKYEQLNIKQRHQADRNYVQTLSK